MSWLREDSGEVLDDRIGDLQDREYRALHALRQYVAREANETGMLHEKRANRAVFSTPRGMRTCTATILGRLIQLGLVVHVETLTDEYLDVLGVTRPEGPGWLRISQWEKYNPPRDRTRAERQRRWRDAQRNAVTNASHNTVTNGPSRAGGYEYEYENEASGSTSEIFSESRTEARPLAPAQADAPEPEPNGHGEIESIGKAIEASLAEAKGAAA